MEEVDKLIKEMLFVEEARFYDELEEENLRGMVGSLFKGKLKWILILMNIVHLFAFIGIVLFLDTDVTNELIKGSTLGFVFLAIGSMLKLFTWQKMNKNALLCEIKRLELQISVLSSKLP